LHALLYAWNCVFHFIVVGGYWGLLSHGFFKSPPGWSRFNLVVTHGVELLIVLLEIGLGSMRLNGMSLLPVLVMLVLYTLWTYIYHGAYVHGRKTFFL
jgi:hypothetical protein